MDLPKYTPKTDLERKFIARAMETIRMSGYTLHSFASVINDKDQRFKIHAAIISDSKNRYWLTLFWQLDNGFYCYREGKDHTRLTEHRPFRKYETAKAQLEKYSKKNIQRYSGFDM